MYNKIFAKFISIMESISVMESYPGEKKDLVWERVFELPEIKEYELTDDVKDMQEVQSSITEEILLEISKLAVDGGEIKAK